MKIRFLYFIPVLSFLIAQSAYAGKEDEASESTGSRHAKKLSHSKDVSHRKRGSHAKAATESQQGGHRVNLSIKSKEDENLSRNIVMPIQWNPQEPLTFNVIYKDIQMKIRIDHQ